jgi:hypothetical protein
MIQKSSELVRYTVQNLKSVVQKRHPLKYIKSTRPCNRFVALLLSCYFLQDEIRYSIARVCNCNAPNILWGRRWCSFAHWHRALFARYEFRYFQLSSENIVLIFHQVKSLELGSAPISTYSLLLHLWSNTQMRLTKKAGRFPT